MKVHKKSEQDPQIKRGKFPLADASLDDFSKVGRNALFAPIDISSIVFFRILFGAIMLWEIGRYFSNGWIKRYWIDPRFHFTYWPFDFLQPLPGNGMYVLFGLLGVLAFFIMIGFLYRASAVLFFIGFSYTYLLEQTRYLNHFYLVILISFLLIFIPANKSASVDAARSPNFQSNTISAWTLWVLRFTIGLPYFFGGVAKINGDWLRGEPMRSWLAKDTDFPFIGPFFTEEWMVMLITYSGLLVDLLMIPLLLFQRTRKWAFAAAVIFHLMNTQLFQIGIFPWFMLVATTMFFHPSWPRHFLYAFYPDKKRIQISAQTNWSSQLICTKHKMMLSFLFLWVLLHVFTPFRHLLIKGNVHWTEEGHKYAWHMKLRSKRAFANFTVRDKITGVEETIDNGQYLKKWQEKKMAGWPNLVWKYGQLIKREYQRKGRDVAVFADVMASLNGRDFQQLIDPGIDIAATSLHEFEHDSWIVPLKVPLEQRSAEESGEAED